MAGEAGELTRQKHRRSSPDDEVDRSRGRKHRRHRHRSKHVKEDTWTSSHEELGSGKIGEIEVGATKLGRDGGDGRVGEGAIAASCGLGFAGVDHDMEEGEIVEGGGSVEYFEGDGAKVPKNLLFDVESGEIGMNRFDNSSMGVDQENVERSDKNLRKLVKDSGDGKDICQMVLEKTSNFKDLAQGDSALKYHKDNFLITDGGVKIRDPAYEVERRQRKSLSSEKRQRIDLDSGFHDKHMQEGSHSYLLKPSILRETSAGGTPGKMEEPYPKERKQQNEPDDKRIIAHDKYCRNDHGSNARDKETKFNSTKFIERTEMHYSREILGRYGNRNTHWDRDTGTDNKREEEERKRDNERGRFNIKDREWGEREMDKDRDTTRKKGRDWERELERDRDRVREERDRDRDRDRDRGREGIRDGRGVRNKDKDRDNERVQFSMRPNFDVDGDGYRNRDSGSTNRRDFKYQRRDRSRRSDLGNLSSKSIPGERDRVLKREDGRQEEYQERITMQLAELQEDDLDSIKEESRRRREAILGKYNTRPTQKIETQSKVMVKEQVGHSSEQVKPTEVTVKNIDIRVEKTDTFDGESSFSVGKSPSRYGPALERHTVTGGLGEGSPKSEGSVDMFCEDTYRESPAGVRKMSTLDGMVVEKSGLHDNWDDAEGYYGYRIGEILDGRYEVVGGHGKGVFSTVVRAKDLKAKPHDPEEVAIKIIRNNETMYKAGMEELAVLKKLVNADPENKRHCVCFFSTFKYRNHLCLVFESLNMNLREVLKKFGRNIGLKLTAVREFAKQLFIALKHLKKCGVLHCDIKPDNMLVNDAKNTLKLCDFGSAMFAGTNEITPYLVSRFYRAPEIILGLPYDYPLDIWSVGCCLFELYTGKVLFPGTTNNEMLRLQMELKGPFPKKMLRKGGFVDHHFDQNLNFLTTEEDPVTKKLIRRLVVNIKPKDFGTLISGSPGEDPKVVANYKDLMEKILVLDPEKRLDISQALSHPFITGK